MQDAVLAIPGRPDWNRPASAFDGTNEAHREQMWIARVTLFFKCNFRRPGLPGPLNPLIPCTLALVSRLRDFTLPEARKFQYSPQIMIVAFILALIGFSRGAEGQSKKEACAFCMSALQSATIESFRQQTSLRGLVWLRVFWTACQGHGSIPHHSS